jgi:hypothetical protein
MLRGAWACVTCEAAGRAGRHLEYVGELARPVDGVPTPCSVWRCPAGHERWTPHRHGGPVSNVWCGTAVREVLVKDPLWGWINGDEASIWRPGTEHQP